MLSIRHPELVSGSIPYSVILGLDPVIPLHLGGWSDERGTSARWNPSRDSVILGLDPRIQVKLTLPLK